jgi:DoxX
MELSLAADYASLLARVCLSAVFRYSGFDKLTDRPEGRAEMMGAGLPLPSLDLAVTIVCQLAGGLMVLLGFWPRLGACALQLHHARDGAQARPTVQFGKTARADNHSSASRDHWRFSDAHRQRFLEASVWITCCIERIRLRGLTL